MFVIPKAFGGHIFGGARLGGTYHWKEFQLRSKMDWA